jgi:hypothetical protein
MNRYRNPQAPVDLAKERKASRRRLQRDPERVKTLGQRAPAWRRVGGSAKGRENAQ